MLAESANEQKRPKSARDDDRFSGNRLIAQLAVHERNAIYRAAELVPVTAGQPLLRSNTAPDFAYFPVDTVGAVVRTLRDGTSVELALIGNEGLLGIEAFFDVVALRDDVIARTPGWAYRIAAVDLKNELRRGHVLLAELLRFAGSLAAQISQTAICLRFHEPEQRLARWLLMIRQRTPSPTVPMASMALRSVLAVSETRTASAVKRLVAERCIRATNDTLSITDVESLEASACECYAG